MARIIKAPNVRQERPYRVVERDKVLKHVDDEAAEILQAAHEQEENILKSAAEQADMILADAQQQAEEIKANIQAETEQQKEEAIAQAHQQGLQQGLEDARQQAAGVLQELKQWVVQGQEILEGMFRDQEAEIRLLVAEIVGRVIQEKLDADDEIVARVAQECIHQAADRQKLRILVHPDDQAKIEEWTPKFTSLFDDVEKITIEIDPRVKRGGVIIESGTGGVDGRIDQQLEILNDTLLNP